MPNLNDLMSPDMQKIALFMVPALAALSIFVMNLSRGFSTVGIVALVILTGIALYFAPQFLTLF